MLKFIFLSVFKTTTDHLISSGLDPLWTCCYSTSVIFSISAKKLSVFHLKKENIKNLFVQLFLPCSGQLPILKFATSRLSVGSTLFSKFRHAYQCFSWIRQHVGNEAETLCKKHQEARWLGGRISTCQSDNFLDKWERPSQRSSVFAKWSLACWGSKLWFSSWNLQSFAMPFIWCSRSGADIAILCRSWPAIPYRNGRRAVQRIHLYFFLQLHTYSIPLNPPIAFLAVKSVPYLRSTGLRSTRNRGRIRSEFIIYVIQVSPLFPPIPKGERWVTCEPQYTSLFNSEAQVGIY